jgi:general secretion pathway protein C
MPFASLLLSLMLLPAAIDTNLAVDSSVDPLHAPLCPDTSLSIVTQAINPDESLATLRAPGEASPRTRRAGARVGDRQLAFIGYSPRAGVAAVWLTRGTELCQVLMGQPAATAPAAEPSPQTPTPRSALSRLRVTPEYANGAVVGVRLFGIGPDSLLAQIGFESGDRLETVNGVDVTTPERALTAYAKLRTESHFSVAITRRGARVVLEYHIV